MTHLKLYIGDSARDITVKEMIETWITDKREMTVEYLYIHADPVNVVRLGITLLPALVLGEEIIAQGAPENWVLPLLDRVFGFQIADYTE